VHVNLELTLILNFIFPVEWLNLKSQKKQTRAGSKTQSQWQKKKQDIAGRQSMRKLGKFVVTLPFLFSFSLVNDVVTVAVVVLVFLDSLS
jgi:hypothetical protein